MEVEKDEPGVEEGGEGEQEEEEEGGGEEEEGGTPQEEEVVQVEVACKKPTQNRSPKRRGCQC